MRGGIEIHLADLVVMVEKFGAWLLANDILLAAKFQDFAVRIRVLGEHESGASSRSILWNKSPGFEANPASVAKRLRPERACPPLGSFL